MKTFLEFVSICEAYDAAFMSGAQVSKTGEGGRIGANRKKTAPEMRRKSQEKDAQGNRKAIQLKDRKDIGNQKGSQSQAPTQERGSADVKARAEAAAKEERRKAAQARAAAKNDGEKPKAKSKDLEKEGSKLISKNKSTEVDLRPANQPKRAIVGPSKEKRKKIIRDGGRKLRSLLIAAKSKKLGIPPEKVKLDKSF